MTLPLLHGLVMNASAPQESSELSYEQSLQQLEGLVARLEGGEISLEDALRDFERGVLLVRQLRERLDQAQQKIESIMATEDGEAVAQPLRLDEGTDAHD